MVIAAWKSIRCPPSSSKTHISFSPFCSNSAGGTRDHYDVVIVGGGHAGCEGAAAAARIGARTLLITQSKEKIGEMSCNPSFGGIGKGHLLREIDAMDGVCARICDQTGFSWRVLNRRNGPAVMGLRALIDRKLYKRAMQEEILHKTPNLDVVEASVEDLCLEERTQPGDDTTHRITGCFIGELKRISTSAIVITTGTFLNGKLLWGDKQMPGGRIGEAPSTGLASIFSRLGFKTGRLKTGTPPRIQGSTIDYSKFTKQPSDEQPVPFSFLNTNVGIPHDQHLPTFLGYLSHKVVQLVRENIDDSHPMVGAQKEGISGPRYCPSLELKCLRFPDLNHRIFLEPEGLDTPVIYPQSCSMGFGPEIQLKIMRAIDGLENIEIIQPGYYVHYDFVHPQQLWPTLETRRVTGLFLAGQINGTTGYEEAAAQGLIAGANAAHRARATRQGEAEYSQLLVDRNSAYIGVMIDDLISFGVTEPYRVFTSRSENRLHLRPDNADLRLTEMAREAGLVSERRWSHYQKTKSRMAVLRERLESLKFNWSAWNDKIPGLNTAGKSSLAVSGKKLLLKHPELNIVDKLAETWPNLFSEFAGDTILEDRLRNEERYVHLEESMRTRLEQLQKEMDQKLPKDIDYLGMRDIKEEVRERLHELRPGNLATAARIPGVNDLILYLLLRHAKS